MTWGEASYKIEGNIQRILSQEVLLFQGELLRRWPVDTGFSRRSWMAERVSPYKYVMTNEVNYSPFVWLGDRKVKGTFYEKGKFVSRSLKNMRWWASKGGEEIFLEAQERLTERLQREYAK